MDWKKWMASVGGVLFAVAAAIVHLKTGPGWLQSASLVAMTALGAMGLGVTPPILAGSKHDSSADGAQGEKQ